MYRVYLRQEADYQKLAQQISGGEQLLCPACGGELMLELHQDQARRGCWYQATVYCPACGEDDS
jgi:competence CoiA-like predicted nuclease